MDERRRWSKTALSGWHRWVPLSWAPQMWHFSRGDAERHPAVLLEVNKSRTWIEAWRRVAGTGDKRRTKTFSFWSITGTTWKNFYCPFMDKYNYINSAWRWWRAPGCPRHLTCAVWKRLCFPAGNAPVRLQKACRCPLLCWEGQKELKVILELIRITAGNACTEQ